MNSLNGEVPYAFDRVPESPRPYHLDVSRIRCFADGDLTSVVQESSQVFCAMVGYLSNGADLAARYDIQAKTDVEIAAALFSLGGLDRIGQLDGMFTLFLADERSQKAFLLQDELACCLPLYYTSTSNAFIFGTQLKHVLAKMGSARTLNLQACYDALFNGHIYQANIVPNSNTLVQGVYKLTPGSVLEVGLAEPGYRIRRLRRHRRTRRRVEARQNLMAAIDAGVRGFAENLCGNELALALSGGFDTNYLLHCVRHHRPSPIKAFTVGGRKVNEIAQVRSILSHYSHVRLVASTIESSAIERLGDIVWRLEGYVYQSGVFLQYELGRQAAANGVTFMLVGDGADQFLNVLFLNEFLWRPLRTLSWSLVRLGWLTRDRERSAFDVLRAGGFFRHIKRSSSPVRDYYTMLDYILKKNGVLLNSFGIQGIYPYLTRDVRELAPALGLASYKKTFFKKRVIATLGPDIAGHLKKTGGTTDVEYLFADRLDAIFKCITNSRVVNALFSSAQVAEIARMPCMYWHLATQLLSLHIFDVLFLSGAYDHRFQQEGLDVPLDGLLE